MKTLLKRKKKIFTNKVFEQGFVVKIKQQCDEQGSAFFFKQWGGVNKKKTGRALGGRTYDEMPSMQVI